MSHFYGNLQGSRGEATRCGTAWSGITSHVRGWHVGTEASAHVDAGEDAIRLVATHGSTGGTREAIGSVRLDEDGTLVLQPSAWTIAQVQRWQRAERKRLRVEARAAEHAAKLQRYAEARAEGYAASTAWHYASQPPAPALDWTEDASGLVANVQAGGFTVRLRSREDADASYWQRGTFTDSWSPDVVPLPEPRERGTYRYWRPDEGMSYREHRSGLRKLGKSKHEAHVLASRYVAADFAAACRGVESVYVVATAYAAGVELGSASIGGCELDTSSRAPSVERQLDAIVSDYGLVDEAVREATAARAKLVATEAR